MDKIFEDFSDKQSLIDAVASAIVEAQNDDGTTVYRIPNKDAETFKAKYEAEVRNAKNQREKKQEAEAKLAELGAQHEKDAIELQQLRELNPADLKATLQKYVDQTAESTKKIRELEQELVPLREANQKYQDRERRTQIENELVSAALKLNCCETALRDVKRLAPLFVINEAGLVVSKDGNRLVQEVLQEEIEQSPHWLKRSQSAGSNPGTGALTSEAKFREALKGNDFAAVLANAPRQSVK